MLSAFYLDQEHIFQYIPWQQQFGYLLRHGSFRLVLNRSERSDAGL